MQVSLTYEDQKTSEAKRLLPEDEVSTEMADVGPESSAARNASQRETMYTDDPEHEGSSTLEPLATSESTAPLTPGQQTIFKVYKRRWFGLGQLVLLNIVVSWDWLSFSPVANTAAEFYSTNPSTINWLSTAFLFAFVVAAPFTIYALHAGGPRLAIITASFLILIGNWIRYGGTRVSSPSFGLTMFGQILIGFAQPFLLSAPTRYSDIWFTPQGRVTATAIASLANPFGGAVGQLVNPFLATQASDIPNMTLYVTIISTVATIPSFFVPSKPPTPVSASSTHAVPSLSETVTILSRNPTFWLVFLPFAIYGGFFNSISSLLTQILTPYKFSESDSGIAGAVLILVGLIAAAITSPIVDRTKAYLIFIRVLVPVIATSYLAFIWAPGTRSDATPYVILGVLGAASFSLVPIALEWLVEVTFPVGPGASSTICWSGGQLLGGIFIIISDALKGDKEANPPFNMGKALVFQAVIAIATVPCVFLLGTFGKVENMRLDVDKGAQQEDLEER